jgi:hypothetical protein
MQDLPRHASQLPAFAEGHAPVVHSSGLDESARSRESFELRPTERQENLPRSDVATWPCA